MRLFGLLVVRNGVDLVRLCVLHHLAIGAERIMVVDNGSTDGTVEVLKRLAAKVPLSWSSDTGPYVQHEIVTGMAHEAARAGADWLLPLDHDEFWVSQRPLAEVLDASDAAALRVPMVNFVQRREQRDTSPRALLTMTYRAARTVEPIEAQALVEANELSFLEYEYPPKLFFRASTEIEIQRGAHWAKELSGPIEDADGAELLHAPLPARSSLAHKAEQGRRIIEAGFIDREAWHARRWAVQEREGRLDEEWKALSYADGHLDVYGRRHPLVPDTRLRDVTAPWIRSPVAQLAARVARRSY